MDEFHFLRPMWLLALVPALASTCWMARRQSSFATWKKIVDPHLLEHLLVRQQSRRSLRPIHLVTVLWILTSVALAGPAWRKVPSPFADDSAGLVVLLKVSGTMMATDVQPSRLERAKHKLRDLLELRPGSSTALIAYSGSAHLVMPLTRDDRIISAMVEDLTPDLMPKEGDSLNRAMELADQVLKRAGVAGSVVVMADAVAPSQIEALTGRSGALPTQFLSLQSPSSPVDSGLQAAASALDAPVVKLTADGKDIAQLANRAHTRMVSVVATESGERWSDAGYAMVALIALCALMWSRKGWVLRWD